MAATSTKRLPARFKSRDFIFRPTSLAQALEKAGVSFRPTLVREPKREVLGRTPNDYTNSRPSRVRVISSDVRNTSKRRAKLA